MRDEIQAPQIGVYLERDDEGVMIFEEDIGERRDSVSINWASVPALIKSLKDALAERT